MVTVIYDSKLRNHVIQHAHRENTASITAGDSLLSNTITPSKTPCVFKITISMSVAGKLHLFRNGLTQAEILNDDVALVANTPYNLEVEIARGDDTIDLEYSVNSGIEQLIVKEVPG